MSAKVTIPIEVIEQCIPTAFTSVKHFEDSEMYVLGGGTETYAFEFNFDPCEDEYDVTYSLIVDDVPGTPDWVIIEN